MVTNPVPATGGADRETLEHARRQAPAEVRSLWKAVTKEDYLPRRRVSRRSQSPGPDVNDCKNIRYYRSTSLWPRRRRSAVALLKQNLAEHLESRKVITVEINLFDPVYRPVSIDAEVLAYAGEDLDLVRSRVEQALADYFAFDRMSFGAPVHFSDLVALLDGVRGVSHVRMYTPTQDVDIRAGQIAALGQVNLEVRRAS